VSTTIESRLAKLEAAAQAEKQPKRRSRRSGKVPTLLQFVESLQIEDKVSGKLVPFKLWPAQRRMLRAMRDNDRLFLLKARQLGATWLDLAFWLYAATFWGNRLILLARQSGEDAADGIRRVRLMAESMPPEWRPEIVVDNVMSIEFGNGSRFQALTATKRIGRGRAAYGGLADEAAFWEYVDEQLTALDAACERLHLLTTGNGADDATHRLWMQAQAGRGRWVPKFYPWSTHPDRDRAWYRLNVEEAPEPRLARREYPSTPEEAFASPEGVFFERFDSTRNTADIEVAPEWRTFRFVDHGYRSPACGWAQQAPSGQLFVIAELVPHNLTTTEFAEAIRRKDVELGVHPSVTYCDPAGRAVNVQTSESEEAVFRAAGLNPVSRQSSIRDGCVQLIGLLADPEIPLVVSRGCEWLVRALSTIRPDRHKPEVYAEDSEFCHILDALRYLVVNTHRRPVEWEPGKPGRTVAGGTKWKVF